MRTLEDVLLKLTRAKYYTKLDARSRYWSIKLSTESSYLTTFNSPFGRFRFLRLPFGLNSSQDEFQRQIYEIFEDLDGIVVLVDDILYMVAHVKNMTLRSMLTNLSRKSGILGTY